MKKSILLLICAACTMAASCDVRIGNTANNPVTPTSPNSPVVAVINSFTTDNALLVMNQSTNLRWSATGACRIDPFVGDVPNSGFTPITPLFTVTYSLSCVSSVQTVSRTVTVTVR